MAAPGPAQRGGAPPPPPAARWAGGGAAAATASPHPEQQQKQQQASARPRATPAGPAAQTPPRHPLAALVADHFPPIAYGFAYGSGVFAQPELGPGGGAGGNPANAAAPAPAPASSSGRGALAGAGAGGPMTDFIFVVDDPEEWHALNLERNARHYSAVAWLGPGAVAAAAEGLGAGVWFNTLVPLGGRLVKYGVIGRAAFLGDLTAWHHLYVPGRLHKPVLPLVALPGAAAAGGGGGGGGGKLADAADAGAAAGPGSRSSGGGGGGAASGAPPSSADAAGQLEIAAALSANLAAALRAALLLSPSDAPLRDVVRRVAGLSYEGDVRMGLAEDSRKVERIVAGSFPGFCDLYLPLLRDPAAWGAAAGGGGALVELEGDAPHGGLGGAGGGLGAGAEALGRLRVRQDVSAEARAAALAALPAALLARIAERAGVRRPWAAAAALQVPLGAGGAPGAHWARSELAVAAAAWRRDVAWAAVTSGRAEALLHRGLRSIIRASSARQAAVGVLSAGAVKSVRYLGAKLAKAWRL
jgi:hypothetical protein